MAANGATTRAFQSGLIIFALTALIGLVNATKIAGDLDHDTLLTHLHSGTLGWITMGVIGIAIWVFAGAGPNLSSYVLLSALVTAAYVMAFWSGNFILRAVFGVAELAVILYWWWWVVSRAMAEGYSRLSVPKLSLALGLTTLVIGSTLGVILQILFATGNVNPQTAVMLPAHASAQVGGYLVLVSVGVVELLLAPGLPRTRLGEAQTWLLFLGGLTLAIGFLTGVLPLLGLSNLLQAIGIIIVVVRLGRRVAAAPWLSASGQRHAAIAIPFVVLGLVLIIDLVRLSISGAEVPSGLLNALNHTMFVGLMTNVLFGAILVYSADRPRVWPWADQLIFWGLNIGAASFIAVLLFVGTSAGQGAFAHPVAFTAPVMGLSALLGIATFFMRLREPAAAPAPAMA
jgi:hypothetical protein